MFIWQNIGANSHNTGNSPYGFKLITNAYILIEHEEEQVKR